MHGAGGFCRFAVGVRVGGGTFINDVREGHVVDWADHRLIPDQVDCMMAALGLLHMQVSL